MTFVQLVPPRLCVLVVSTNRSTVRRLLALCCLAFALAVSSGPAFAAPAHDCPMMASQSMQVSHEDMGCCDTTCAPECAAVCPIAVEPALSRSVASADHRDQLLARPSEALLSTILSCVDPPPRTTFS